MDVPKNISTRWNQCLNPGCLPLKPKILLLLYDASFQLGEFSLCAEKQVSSYHLKTHFSCVLGPFLCCFLVLFNSRTDLFSNLTKPCRLELSN